MESLFSGEGIKEIELALPHLDLYAVELRRAADAPFLLYVHGGPGSHCHYFKEALASLEAFQSFPMNWLLYDQAGCGRSPYTQEPTHQSNVDQLKSLLAFARDRYGQRFAGVVGHSYGAWLAYDALITCEFGVEIPLYLIGTDRYRRTTRGRNFMIEIMEAKIKAPAAYQGFLESLPEFANQQIVTRKDGLRSIPYDRDMRRYFYWANLERMSWYEGLKTRVDIPESDRVFAKVRDSMAGDDGWKLDFDLLHPKSTRFIGYQDFLMNNHDSFDDRTLIFAKSGHYPHFEQTESFLAALQSRVT